MLIAQDIKVIYNIQDIVIIDSLLKKVNSNTNYSNNSNRKNVMKEITLMKNLQDNIT